MDPPPTRGLVNPTRATGLQAAHDQGFTYVYNTYVNETLTGRLNFRLSSDQERSLRQAAELTGQSVTGFVLSSAVIRAHELLERANTIELSDTVFRKFVADLDKPAEVVPQLVRLFDRSSQIPPD